MRAIYQSPIDATVKLTEKLGKALNEVNASQKNLEYLLNSAMKTLGKTTVLYNEPPKVILLSENKKEHLMLDQFNMDLRNIFPI